MYKHQEIFEEFKSKILNYELKDGDILPTEKELCGIYGVSRITAMRAVKDLALENLVNRISGKGTFVCYHKKRMYKAFHLIVPVIWNKYYSELAGYFNDFFEDTPAYGAVVCAHYKNPLMKKSIESLVKSGSCGIAVIPSGSQDLADGLTEIISQIDIPIVIGSRELAGFKGVQVIIDEEQAGIDAVEHLVGLGHRRIAYIGQMEKYSSAVLRYRGFMSACAEAGLSESDCPHIEKVDHIALRHVKDLFNSENAPTAVVAPSEAHALEAYDLLTSLGLKIPGDVALLGLDGRELAPAIEAPLTTIDFPGSEIGHRLAEALWNIHNGVKVKNEVQKIKAPLVIRASCGAHPEKYRHEYLRNLIKSI